MKIRTKLTPEDKSLIRQCRREARADGARFLQERRAISSRSEKKAFRTAWREHKKTSFPNRKTMNATEYIARCEGRKVFYRRIHRRRRLTAWALVAALLCSAVFFCGSGFVMFSRAARSQHISTTGADAEIARANAYSVSSQICEEGIVLLKNDGLLPLADLKLNVFGDDAYHFVCTAGKGAPELPFFRALEKGGITVNPTLHSLYLSALHPGGNLFEKAASFLRSALRRDSSSAGCFVPDEAALKAAAEWSSQAVLVLGASAATGEDVPLSLLSPAAPGSRSEALIRAVCTEFDHVIVVINSANVMALSWCEEFDAVDAVLVFPDPGSIGCTALASVLTGAVNPSGRTADTWPVSLSSSPAAAVYGTHSYANLSSSTLLEYSQGIYNGYAYYETRFGASEEEYSSAVVYPFGHGLSYTEFEESVTAFSSDEENVSVTVSVKNTGSLPGKDVVELYFMPPYYMSSGIEKSAIRLAAFGKTALLAPDESEELVLSFPVRDMASWSSPHKAYVLEHGDYRLALGKNVHAALLSDSYEVYSVPSDLFFSSDALTGAPFSAGLSAAQGSVTSLSRNDWDGTFPSLQDKYIASAEVKQASVAFESLIFPDGSAPAERAPSSDFSVAALRGLPYDAPEWQAFLDALSAEEMIRLVSNGAWHTEAVSSVGLDAAVFTGDERGLSPALTGASTVIYPAPAMLGATWNTALAASFGSAIAAEAESYGISGWYGPRANLHVVPQSGVNSLTYSEDATLTGAVASSVIRAARQGGLVTVVSGFVCDDSAAASGFSRCTWLSEQALREVFLRPFEMAVKLGDADAVMAAPVRLGVEWCFACDALLNGVLRSEWGFTGLVSTPPLTAARPDVRLALSCGSSLLFDSGLRQSEKVLRKAVGSSSAALPYLREAAHAVAYTLVNR